MDLRVLRAGGGVRVVVNKKDVFVLPDGDRRVLFRNLRGTIVARNVGRYKMVQQLLVCDILVSRTSAGFNPTLIGLLSTVIVSDWVVESVNVG